MIKRLSSIKLQNSGLMAFLSFCTICMLVCVAIIVMSIITLTPIIMLGLSELQQGQRDLILQPALSVINSTKVSQLSGLPSMPRIFQEGSVNRKIAHVWLMDLDLERQQHLGFIGGDLPQNTKNKQNLIYVNQDIGSKPGQTLNIFFRQRNYLGSILRDWEMQKKVNDTLLAQLKALIGLNYLFGQFQVQETFSTSMGKFGQGKIDSNIYIDIKTVLPKVIRDTYNHRRGRWPNFQYSENNSELIRYFSSKEFNLGDYANQITINIPQRIEVYSNPDYQSTFQYASDFGLQTLNKLGLFSVSSQMPIAAALVPLGYFGMFLGIMLKLIIATLFLLSVLMMYNMTLMSIQRKNFDFALLKVLGSGKVFVILNVWIDSLKYVILANIVAYPISYIVLYFASDIFKDFFGYSYDVYPTNQALIGAFIIGVLVPIVSATIPLKDIIYNNNLVQNLNPLRNKTQAFHTQIYIQGRQFPYGKMIFGILATGYGLMVYYLLPKGLIDQNVGLLLSIFFIILLGLLLGLIMFSYSFQYILEKIVAYVCFFWLRKTDFTIMTKNLSAHRIKNRRASILYALSVAFVVFISVGIAIQIQTIQKEYLANMGSYVSIFHSPQGRLNSQDISIYNTVLAQIPQIQAWAYVTTELSIYLQQRGIKNILISDKAKTFFKTSRIFGVSPNFMQALYSPQYSQSRGPKLPENISPYQFLYTQQGNNTAIISEYMYQQLGLNQEKNRQFYINKYGYNEMVRFPINFSIALEKKAGLKYSKLMISRHDTAVSLQTYKNLAQIGSIEDIPYNTIHIRPKDITKTAQLANKIRNLLSNYINPVDRVRQYSQFNGTIQKIDSLLSKVLLILLVLVLLISFFSLISTSYVNILNQTNEIAILLTLGMTKQRIIMIYIYEAFVLVFSSCLIGVGVGSFVAQLMGLQRELFGDYSINVQINGIWLIVIAAVFSSILSTMKPAKDILSKPIAGIFKYS